MRAPTNTTTKPIARGGEISTLEQLLAALMATGIIVAVSQDLVHSRAPIAVYVSYGVLQLFCGMAAVYRKNLFSAILGICFSVVLLMACAIENATYLPFDASLTSRVYRPELIAMAYAALLASTCGYWFVVIWFGPKQEWIWRPADVVERTFAARYAWVALWAGVALTALTTSAGFIADEQYGSAAHSAERGALAGDSGLALLSSFLLVVAMMSALRCWGYSSKGYRVFAAIALCTILYFRWFRGQRSSSLPVLLSIIFLFHMNSRVAQWKKIVGLTTAVLVLVAALNIWAAVRSEAARVGTWNAVTQNLDAAVPDFSRPLRIKMLPQSYWHLLHTIDLYESGVRLDGASFADLIPQSIPEVVANSVGYQRPPSGPVRLFEYRVHGGGMFILGEGYWNFGLIGAMLVALASALLAVKLEAWFRRQDPIVVCSYFATIGTVGFGVYYGLQTFVKSIEIALALGVVMKLMLGHMRKRAEFQARLVALQIHPFRRGADAVSNVPVMRSRP